MTPGDNMLPDGDFWPTQTPYVEHDLVLAILEIAPSFGR